MKRYEASYWRVNPQLPSGGYETKRVVEAKTIASARKKAAEIENKCAYGRMILLNVELIDD